MATQGKGAGRELVVQRGGCSVAGGAIAQKRKARCSGWTQARRDAFLVALGDTCNVAESARVVGMTKSGAYQLRARDPGFARAWLVALEQGYSELELLLLRQALHGTERTETIRESDAPDAAVTCVKTVHSFSMAISITLLKAHRDRVGAFREAVKMEKPDDPDVIARVRDELARMKARAIEVEARRKGQGRDSAGAR